MKVDIPTDKQIDTAFRVLQEALKHYRGEAAELGQARATLGVNASRGFVPKEISESPKCFTMKVLDLIACIVKQKAEVERLRAALRPFAEFAPYAIMGDFVFRPKYGVVPFAFPNLSDFQ